MTPRDCKLCVVLQAVPALWRWAFGPLCSGAGTIAMAIAKHLIQAIVLVLGPAGAVGSIGIHALLSFTPGSGFVQRASLAGVLVMAGLLARHAMRKSTLSAMTVCLLLLPQQILLLIAWFAALSAIFSGHYADGYRPDGAGWFILGDQTVLLVLAPSYVVALFCRASARARGDDNL